MKSFILLAVCIAASGFVAAQEDTSHLDLLKRYHITVPRTRSTPLFYDMRRPQDFRNPEQPKPALVPAFPDAKLMTILPNGSHVFALPQDQMPCIIPDMKQFNMPTVHVYVYKGPGAIPNPAVYLEKNQDLSVLVSHYNAVQSKYSISKY